MIKRIINKLGIYKVYNNKIGDQTFRIPVFNNLGFTNLSLPEPWMQTILNKIGSHDSTFLDVGVNIGQTLLRWKSEFPNSKYIGIEPNPNCIYYVNKLIEENNFKDATLLPVGLSDKQNLNFLYIAKKSPTDPGASIISNFRENDDNIALPIVSISFSLLSQYNFDIIKIDVEGGELEIIKSIFNTKSCNPIFICEILPVYKKENSIRLNRQIEIEQILIQNKYSIYRIIKGNKISLEPIRKIEIHSDLEACDYLFLPKNKEKEILHKFK